ncbi:MAG: aspartate--tRNA ligase [Metamycoplasmataceae bacterium]
MKQISNIDLIKFEVGTNVELFGWVSSIRKLSNLNFVLLRDRTCEVQLVMEDINFTKESVLKINGKINKRKEPNPKMETGKIEILVSSYEVLSLAKELPFNLSDKVNVKEEIRLKYRYLDLRKKENFDLMLLRHKLLKNFRDFLDKENFLEIETPILSKSTPEGARDYLVPTRNLGEFFALPQSPQIYKQLLMSAGIEKYFQIAKVFRDEDLRKDRQPEFTQLDMEISFANEEDIYLLCEKMFNYVLGKLDIKIEEKFPRMKFKDAIEKYGSDKPDTRYELFLNEATKEFANIDLNIFNKKPSIKYLVFNQEISNSQLKAIEEVARKNKLEKLISIKIKDKSFVDNELNKKINSQLKTIIQEHKLDSGIIFIAADEYKKTTQALGAIRVHLAELFDLADPNIFKFLWIVDFPLFEEEDGEIIAMHHPFTSPSIETEKYLEKDLLKVIARSYDLTLNGFELSSGSIRINNFNLQRKIFKALKLSDKQINDKFGSFLEAFDFGFPPHAGTAFGIDRILMIIANQKSIRDTIAFPKNANGYDTMLDCPSFIENEDLNHLGIIIKNNKEKN